MRVRTGIALSLLVLQPLVAQDRAPQNDSIRKEDLRPTSTSSRTT